MTKNQSVLTQENENAKDKINQQQIELLGTDTKVKSTGLQFDFENADRRWEAEYGIVIPPILQNERGTGKLYDNKRWKAILQNDYFLTQQGRNYVVYPNEEVSKNVNTLIKDDPTLKLLQQDGFENPRYTNHGLNMYITLISEKNSFKVKDSHEVGDLVQVGVMIRNSIDGKMGLGADIFTYRLGCLNGALFKAFDLGNDYMRHYGKNTEKITNGMRELITNSMDRVTDISNFYNKMAEKKLGEGNRKSVFKRLEGFIPQMNYPDYVDIETIKINKQDPVDHIYNISNESKSYSMWRVFNDFTQKVWHSKTIGFGAKRYQTKKLHEIIIDSLKDPKVN